MAESVEWARFLLVTFEGPDFWIPMTFILVGLALFLWEITMPGFFVAIPATVSVALGILGLFFPALLTNPAYVLLAGIAIAAPATFITMRLYRRLAPPDAAPTTTTSESLQGRQGTVTVEVLPDSTRGKVRLQGVIWSARTEGDPIPVGSRVEVLRTQGVHVLVRPAEVAAAVAADETEQSGDVFSSNRST